MFKMTFSNNRRAVSVVGAPRNKIAKSPIFISQINESFDEINRPLRLERFSMRPLIRIGLLV